MSLLIILTTSDGSKTTRREGEKFVEKRCIPVVATVIFGDENEVKTGVEQSIIGA